MIVAGVALDLGYCGPWTAGAIIAFGLIVFHFDMLTWLIRRKGEVFVISRPSAHKKAPT